MDGDLGTDAGFRPNGVETNAYTCAIESDLSNNSSLCCYD